MKKKIYILDTSVFLTDFRSLFAYKNHDIVIPLIVLEEIDNNKKRQDPAGSNARAFCRILDQLRQKGNLFDGVRIRKGGGLVFVKGEKTNCLPVELNSIAPDNKIISVAIQTKESNKGRKTILVSCDVNMRIKCGAIGIDVEDYISNYVIKQKSELYDGFEKMLVDEQIIDRFYRNEEIVIKDLHTKKPHLYPNQFLMLVSNSNQKKTALARFVSNSKPIQKIKDFSKDNTWGFETKNKEQQFAMDLLMDTNVHVVSLIGKAGTGKTLTALASGLMQIMPSNDKITPKYSRIIVSKPIQPMGKDIGYLPGNVEEKLSPWLQPVLDNLRFLLGNDRDTLQDYIHRGIIELEALTYIRGRSIPNAFIIIDEAQNLNKHEMKTILTRVGHNTKIVLTGDIEQIDNSQVDERSNGLTHMIEKSKQEGLSGHVKLIKGERSKTATLFSQIL